MSVVLQQMHTTLHGSKMLFTTAMELTCKAKGIKCETDLVVLHPERDGRIGLVVGDARHEAQLKRRTW